MKKSKAISVILSVSLALTALAGCSESKDKTEDGKVKITIGDAPDKNTDPEGFATWEESANAFMKLNSDIEVVPQPWAYDVQSFISRAEGGTLPTLYKVHFTEGKKVIEFDYSADVTSFMKESGDYDKLNKTMLENITDEDGNVKLIPANVYTLGVVMNMKLMRSAGLVGEDDSPIVPQTFDELAEMAIIFFWGTYEFANKK